MPFFWLLHSFLGRKIARTRLLVDFISADYRVFPLYIFDALILLRLFIRIILDQNVRKVWFLHLRRTGFTFHPAKFINLSYYVVEINMLISSKYDPSGGISEKHVPSCLCKSLLITFI